MPMNRHSWYDSIPRSDAQTRFWEHFSADRLKANEIECGDATLAKIPKIEGLISRRKKQNGTFVTTYVELILSRTYDKDKKQSRNKRVIIGIDVSHVYPGMMMINDKYHDYFDRDGNLTYTPEAETQTINNPNTTLNPNNNKTQNNTNQQNNNQPDNQTPIDPTLQDLAQTNTAIARQFLPETEDAEQTEGNSPNQPQPTTANNVQPQPDRVNNPFAGMAVHEILNSFAQSQTRQETTEGDKQLNSEDNETLGPEKNEALDPEEDEEFMTSVREQQHRNDRLDYLNSLLIHYSTVFDEQAKRKPDKPVTLYQVRRVNALLSEIKDKLSGYENEAELLLAEEPSPDSDTPPMTNLDMSILLGSYSCTLTAYRLHRLWFKSQPVNPE